MKEILFYREGKADYPSFFSDKLICKWIEVIAGHYNKLLMSEKASKEKEDFEDKRKSESATQTRFHRPEQMFEFQKKSAFIKTDIQKSDLKLNTYFKSMYNHYYIKLGNE